MSTRQRSDWQGKIVEAVTAPSEDTMCRLTLDKDTMALDKNGHPLREISIVAMEQPPVLPRNRTIIGPSYNIGPAGATFGPPATLSIAYEEGQVPEGIDEKDLVITTWDEASWQWAELEDYVIDPESDTITVLISHLSIFAVMAHTAPPSFTISELTISPAEVEAGEVVTITALVNNSGDLPGSYQMVLTVNDEIVETRVVDIDGGAGSTVTFNLTRNDPGTYIFGLNNLTGSFTVLAEPAPGPAPTTTTTTIAATYKANWWLPGGILLGGAALIIIAWQIIRRRRKKSRQAGL